MSSVVAQNRTKQMVPMKYFDMFAYRMCGLNYKEISTRTGYSYDHVRHVFCRGGVLFDSWRQWTDEFKVDAIERAIDMEYAHLVDIVRANIITAKQPYTFAGVAARKLIFDRIFGKPGIANLQEERKSYTFTDWIREQTLKEKEKERLESGLENSSE